MTAQETINMYGYITMNPMPAVGQYFAELIARQGALEIQAEYVEQTVAATVLYTVDKL